MKVKWLLIRKKPTRSETK